jgi:alcohol dehydrogenase (cytochrome c)
VMIRNCLVTAASLASALAFFAPYSRAASAPAMLTDEQSIAGKKVYEANCLQCHGATLEGNQFGPPLVGASFTDHWAGKTLADYYLKISSSMPLGRSQSLERSAYLETIAYIFEVNGLKPPHSTWPADATGMERATLTASKFVSRDAASGTAVHASQLQSLSRVSDALLRSPPAKDWLIWRRTYDSQGYSPLNQINVRNIKSLGLAWSWALAPGWMEGTPLVHDGVLFVQSGTDTIQALDAANGDLLWSFVRQGGAGSEKSNAGLSTVKRNMAIAGSTLYAATVDAHIIALDARSGVLMWDHTIADFTKGWYVSSGPLVVKDKVITGLAGTTARQPGGSAIIALDAANGSEAWRFDTIARPGQPGGDSWNGLPVEKRSGASIWLAGSYDAELNLVYFGTGNTYDIAPYRTKSSPDADVDLLYTNTTLALNPDDGKLVWYFQHMPHDLMDLDWAFEQTIITLHSASTSRKAVITGGKIALFDAVDAATGKYLFSRDFGLQNIITAVDAATGHKTLNPDSIRVEGKPQFVCPSALGARSWFATSVDPTTNVMYAALDDLCTTDTENYISRLAARPGSQGNFGHLAALDLTTGKFLWNEKTLPIQTSALLATAGGIVFNSNADRWFRANDSKTGAELWKVRLHDAPNAFPITYSVAGRQYVAIAAGGAKTTVGLKMQFTPQVHLPAASNPVLWVFALPSK